MKGAVADAQAFTDYLIKDLRVPSKNLKLLLDRAAKRDKIVKQLLALQDDPRIKHGDPIIIFYAGHGMEVAAPQGWQSGDPNNKIQMILPYDFKPHARPPIHGIPDRTIGVLLDGLSEKKGNNIVS